MITESELYYQVRQVQPRFFGRGDTVDHTYITQIWPLPDKRVLFACAERDQREDHRGKILAFALHVLDQRRGRLKHVARMEGNTGSELAVITAIRWMQGLRADDLSGFDQSMLDYLGELAWRMSPDQLQAFEREYFTYNTEDWGSVEDPNPVPDERLGDLLESQGFSDTYIDMHWQQ